MLIRGAWLPGDDGQIRPVITGDVFGDGGKKTPERFLVDSGADSTALSAAVLRHLALVGSPPPKGLSVLGIGGAQGFVVIQTVLEFPSESGTPARIRGQFLGFQDVTAVEMSILGRDVLDNFDVILSRQRGEVLLLAPNHFYRVESA
jgi:hypothetical protein